MTDEFSNRLEGLKRLAEIVRSQHARYSRNRERGRSDRTSGDGAPAGAPSGEPPPRVSSPSP